MLNVVILGDTAVFSHLLMVCAHQQVCLITVAEVGTEQRVVEVCRTLAVVIAAGINIVELESQAQSLAGIHGEQCLEMVFTVILVTTFLIGQVGDGG